MLQRSIQPAVVPGMRVVVLEHAGNAPGRVDRSERSPEQHGKLGLRERAWSEQVPAIGGCPIPWTLGTALPRQRVDGPIPTFVPSSAIHDFVYFYPLSV